MAEYIAEGWVQGAVVLQIPYPPVRWIEAYGIPVVAFAAPANYIVRVEMRDALELALAELVRRGCGNITVCTTGDPLTSEPELKEWMEPGVLVVSGPGTTRVDQGYNAMRRLSCQSVWAARG